jgi:hypothetical protein
MIDISYENGIRIETKNLKGLFREEQLPLTVEIKKTISKDIVWTTKLDSFMWATYPENEINDVIIKDNLGNFIYQYYWDIMKHGSIFYKSLWLYCKSLINQGIKPRGLVIGTHDGEFGEWVPLVRDYMSDVVLVEGSESQYNRLVKNYGDRNGVEMIFDLITPDGSDVEFFEGGKGYTNTIVERVIRYWEREEVNSTYRTSKSINNLIIEKSLQDMDWLHLDVEGLDAKILFAMEPEFLPKFIIFEDFNLDNSEKEGITNYLMEKNYQLTSQHGICMAAKS